MVPRVTPPHFDTTPAEKGVKLEILEFSSRINPENLLGLDYIRGELTIVFN